MQQVDSRKQPRASTAGSSALPQFDLPAWESADPDRTLERLPALTASGAAPLAPSAPSREASPRPVDADAAATMELVSEVAVQYILEVEAEVAPAPVPPASSAPSAPSAPLDLDRLLARARAEASRSPEYFRSASAPGVVSFPDDPTPVPIVLMAEAPRTTAVAAPRAFRQSYVWAAGFAAAAAFLVAGVAVGQSRSAATSAHELPPQAPPSRAPSSMTRSAAPVAPKNEGVQAVAVQSLPRVESGTISLAAVAASHRLFIDGRVADGGSAIVTCGTHLVQVGSRGVRRRIDVPCGQEIVVAN